MVGPTPTQDWIGDLLPGLVPLLFSGALASVIADPECHAPTANPFLKASKNLQRHDLNEGTILLKCIEPEPTEAPGKHDAPAPIVSIPTDWPPLAWSPKTPEIHASRIPDVREIRRKGFFNN